MPIAILQPTGANALDAYMEQESPTTNDGTGGAIVVGEDNAFAQLFRTLIKFDLTALPAPLKVNSAALTLTYLEAGSWRSSNNRVLSIYRVLRAWTEAGVTWNKYDGTNNWGTAGCSNTTTDRESSACGSGTVATTDADESEVSFTMTPSLLEPMINHIYTNNGFLLQVATESSDRFQFHSGETVTASKAPKLTINYTPLGGNFFLGMA